MSVSHSDVVKYVRYSLLEVCHLLLLPQLQIFLLCNLGVLSVILITLTYMKAGTMSVLLLCPWNI